MKVEDTTPLSQAQPEPQQSVDALCFGRRELDGPPCACDKLSGVTQVGGHSRRMLKKARLLTRPTLARRDAPYPMQGRSSGADPRFTFHTSRFTVPESDARTTLADFFSIRQNRMSSNQAASPAV